MALQFPLGLEGKTWNNSRGSDLVYVRPTGTFGSLLHVSTHSERKIHVQQGNAHLGCGGSLPALWIDSPETVLPGVVGRRGTVLYAARPTRGASVALQDVARGFRRVPGV